jgi:two-component system chemotaxis response regulator CheB
VTQSRADPIDVNASERAARDVHPHDVVVVGASAGGVEALRRLVAALPEDLPASVFVVLHLARNSHSALPEILARAGALPVRHASDGEQPAPGVVYVAPPDLHLLLKPGRLQLLHGPTENGHRPAIDPLFRSAAASYGPRVIGVVLSGVLDDGASGLLAISQAGGMTVAQEPTDALYPSMPMSAIRTVPVDVVATAAEIGHVLERLTAQPLPVPVGTRSRPNHGDYTERALQGGRALELEGRPSRFTCPDCGGALWEAKEEGESKFRCRVGHSWTSMALLEEQASTLEQALWTALRVLAERADLARRMRDHAAAQHHEYAERLFDEQLEELERKGDVVRSVLHRSESTELSLDNELQMFRSTAANPTSSDPSVQPSTSAGAFDRVGDRTQPSSNTAQHD